MKSLFQLAIIGAIVLAACGPGTPPAPPSVTASPPATTPSPEPATLAPTPHEVISQTDTDWGRIWDRLPLGFPTILGATPSDEIADGPASATFVVQGSAVKAIVMFTRTGLEAAGFRIEEVNGPFEDGSYILDASGLAAGCMLRVTVNPMGALTRLTYLYGALCPND